MMIDAPLFQRVVRNTEDSTPFSQGMSFSKGRYIMAGASVIAVFLHGNPSAIFRLIVAIVIDAV